MDKETINPDELFCFQRVGKRMPYKIPDGLFDEMEDRILLEVKQTTRRKRWRQWLKRATAIAAAVGLIVLLNPQVWNKPKGSMDDVEEAFFQLNEEDQQFLLATYQNDYFLEEFND